MGSWQQAINLLAAIATVVVNALANIVPFNGNTTAEVSDRLPVYFTPAGYVFSIWGLIYLGMIIFAIYQAMPSQQNSAFLGQIGYLFCLTCLANSTWIFLWHYEAILLTLPMMLALLFSLIAIYLRLDIGRAPVSAADKWFVHVPFSIYLGWIAVATVANASAVLYYLHWDGWGISPEMWTVIMVVVAASLALAAILSRRDYAYALVAVWAFIGIAVKDLQVQIIVVAAMAMAAVLLLAMVGRALRHA